MGVSLIVWLDYNRSAANINGILSSLPMRTLLLVAAVTFGLTIGYSRLFLGVHSMNQILFGFLLGIWMAFTLHFIFRDKVLENVQRLLDGDERRYKRMLITFFIIMFITFALEILVYVAISP